MWPNVLTAAAHHKMYSFSSPFLELNYHKRIHKEAVSQEENADKKKPASFPYSTSMILYCFQFAAAAPCSAAPSASVSQPSGWPFLLVQAHFFRIQ